MQKSLKPSLYFFVGVFVAFAILIAYAASAQSKAEWLFAYTSFYFFNGLLIAWSYCKYNWTLPTLHGPSPGARWGALLFALVITLIVWFGVEHSFKVLSDEANLMAISQSLAFEKTSYNHTMGRWYYDNFWPLANGLDKRPILFPYLLHFFHVILGYSVANVFLFNAILLFLLLYLVFLIAYPVGGFLTGIAAMLFVVSQPIVPITAISGGFDLLACLLQIYVAYLVLQLCWKEDDSLRPLIWYTLILLVHTRYENLIAFPIVMSCLWFFGRFTLADLKKHPYLYSLSLLFLLPRIWQLLVPQNYENPPGVPVIGWSNFVKHFPIFAQDFFNLRFELPYATLLNIACLGILLVWGIAYTRKRQLMPRTVLPFVLVLLAFAGSELCISLSHHFGVFNHPTQARLFLVFVVTLSLTPLLLTSLGGRKWSGSLLAVSTVLFLTYFPIARENRFVNKLTIIRKTHWTYEFIESLNNPNILVIVDRPGIYTIRPVGAVDFTWAKANRTMIRDDLKRHLYDAVYVIEDITYNTNHSPMSEVFALETVFERQNTPEQAVRISKVLLQSNTYQSDGSKYPNPTSARETPL